MAIVHKSGDPAQSGHAQYGTLHEAAPLSEWEAARRAVFAAFDDLIEAGLATWRERCADGIELRGAGGEVWLLDDTGVTRLR